MFEVDERFPDSLGSFHAVRDDVRGLGLRLKERGPGGEGDQYRFVRHRREHVLFVTGGISRDRRYVVFTIEHGDLDDDGGVLAAISRRFLISDLHEAFLAYARLILRFEGEQIELNFRAPETVPTSKELVAALAGLRKRNSKFLDELYETIEANRPITGDQFGELLATIKVLKIRTSGSQHAFASDLLPYIVSALKGPFGRKAPNFVRRAMDKIAITSVLIIAFIWWAVPNGLRVIFDIAGGQLQRETLVNILLDLMAGALSLSIGGAAIYSTIVLWRLAKREQTLTYIRTGKLAGARAPARSRGSRALRAR
jgi:hypothetical protein